MSTVVLPGIFYRESEFQELPSGQWLTGACGPNALAMAASWATQRYASTLDVYATMHAHDLCSANGVSTMGSLRAALPFVGLTPVSALDTTHYRAYAEPWDYAAFKAWALARLAAGCAILVEGAYCQALVDALTGKGENARNLRYHFFVIVGYVSGRWVCLDGDNLAVGNFAQHYTDAVMSAAQPCAALAIAGKVKYNMAIDTTHLGGGVRDWLATRQFPATYETLLAERPVPGAADGSTLSVFGDTSTDVLAYWDGTHKCVRAGEWDGHLLTGLLALLEASEAVEASLRHQLVTTQAALVTAQAALATTQGELATAEAKAAQAPAPVPPTPAPATDPADEKFRAAIEAMRAALAALAA